MTLTTSQYRAALSTHRRMVEAGFPHWRAAQAIRRALGRILSDSGLGKFNLHQFTGPRPQLAGEACVTLDPLVIGEPALYERLNQYRSQGWSVMQVEPYKDHVLWYACPPGRLPLENEPLVFGAEEG